MTKTTQFIAILCLLFHGLSVAQESQENDSAPTQTVETASIENRKIVAAKSVEELSSQLEELINYYGIPGMSVAVVKEGKPVLVSGFGLANTEAQEPATQSTLFRIGSVSKMFVSLAILKLENEGKLDLQTPVKDLIPEIEFTNPYADTDPVRVIHLLEHTTGWDDIHLREYANNNPDPVTLKEALDYHPHSRTSRWRPGTRMSYANSGPPVAAYIVQKITGIEFEEYVQTHFFNPLKMDTATYRFTDNNITTLYVDKEPVDYWHISMRPSGSINASATDMANFLLFLSHSGTFNEQVILPAHSIRKMEIPQTTLAAKAGMTHGYGLSNYTSYYKGYKFHGHDGGVQGGSARLVYIPEHKIGFSFAVNTNTQGSGKIFNTIAAFVTKQLLEVEYPTSVKLPLGKAEAYSGYYMPVNPRQEMQRFVSQITGVRHLSLSQESGLLSGSDKSYVPQSESLLRLPERPDANIALLEDENGLAIQVGNQYLQQIPAFRHYSQQGFMWAFVVLLAFHFFWFFWWMGRKLLGKIKSKPAIQIRLWPFLASLSIYAAFIAMVIGQVVDVFALLGNASWASITLMLSTYLFALFTLISVVQNVRYFKEEIHWFSKYVSVFTCLVYGVVVIYFAYFGVIGLQTFA